MSKLFFSTGISLDGFMAGENRGPQNPFGDGGTQINQWMYNQRAFLEMEQQEGGEVDTPDNAMIEKSFANVGAYIMGKRMFDEGEPHWPEDLYKADVYVLTHEVRQPWKQKGSTTFYFITEGIHRALALAQASAQGKDIRLMGGGALIQQFLNAGLVDELTIHIAPLFLGKGIRLLDSINPAKLRVEPTAVSHSALATHLTYSVTPVS